MHIPRPVSLPLLALLALGACTARQEEPKRIETVREVPKLAAAPQVDDATRLGVQPMAPEARAEERTADAASAAPLTWTAPPGWQAEPKRQMRVVSFKLGPEGRTECYVSTLSGEAGGLAANINRWRGQMGLEPLSEEALAALPKITLLGSEAPLAEMSGTFAGMGDGAPQGGYALLGTAARLDGQTLFVKMVGPAAEVTAARGQFIEFCKSLRIP